MSHTPNSGRTDIWVVPNTWTWLSGQLPESLQGSSYPFLGLNLSISEMWAYPAGDACYMAVSSPGLLFCVCLCKARVSCLRVRLLWPVLADG